MRSVRFILAVLLASLAVAAAQAQTAVWVPTAAGTTYDWNLNSNWNPATFPNGIAAVANVNNNIAGNQTIRLNQLIDLQTLNLGDSDATNTFTIAPNGGSLRFNGTAV